MSQKTMIFLKGFAKGLGNTQTLHSLNAAVILHAGQVRKGTGEPYVDHPIMVASELAALGVHDDVTLPVSLLHDVKEDTGISDAELSSRFGISPTIVELASRMDKRGMTTNEHYELVRRHPATLLTKISDRCNNISTMGGAFTLDKMIEYIAETEQYVIPLCKHGKDYYPEYSDAIFVMKYHIVSLSETLKAIIG